MRQLNFLYVVGPAELSRWQSNELRYSLRSIDLANVGWVGVAGPQIPSFLRNIHHIKIDPQDNDRYRRTQRQLLAACSRSDVPEELILMNDDFIVRNPALCRWEPTHMGLITPRKKPTAWRQSVLDTASWLKRKYICNPINYEGHTPFPFLRSFAMPILEEILAQKQILQFRTAYGNLVGVGGKEHRNAKRGDPYKWPEGTHYWSLKGEVSDKAKGFLEKHWPKASRWEVK